MKKTHRFLLLLVIFAVSFAALLWFQSNRLLRSSQMREFLVQKIQTVADATFHYQGVEIGFFPQPCIIFVHPQLVVSDQAMTFEAEKLQLDFNILPMIIGRAEPSSICVAGGKTDTRLPWFPFLGEMALRNFTLKIGAIRPSLAIPIQFTSDVENQKRAIFLKGHLVVDSMEKLDWDKMSSRFLIEVKELPLTSLKKVVAGADSFFLFKGGTFSASLEVGKKQNDPFLEISANGKVAGIGYEVRNDKTWTAPPLLDGTLSFSGAWNAAGEELKIQKMVMELPFGKLEINGGLKIGTGEISKLHFSASDMVLETLLKYWPRFENALPLHLGFSGPCNWMLSLEGTLDHLSLHLNLDLAKTLLSYGAYFAKPKDVPLTATFDYLIQKGATLSGDFSVRFQEMSLKGNLNGLDLLSGTGQLNLLTNKFSMKGLEQYIPALQGYRLEGDSKILANWKGDLRQLEKAEQIFHVTVEKGSWTNMEGRGIKNANLSFDFSPLLIEGKGMQFDLGGAPVILDVRVTDLSGAPQSQAGVISGELDSVAGWNDIMLLFQRKKDPGAKDLYDYVNDSILALFPKGQKLKDFSAEVSYAGGVWELQKFHALAYEGIVDAKGALDLSAEPVKYRCEGEVKGLNFDLFLNRSGGQPRIFDGSLDLKAELESSGWGKDDWRQSLRGKGKFTLMNGKSPMFDLVPPILTIAPFARLAEKVKTLDSFEQLDFSWTLGDGKVSTSDFLVKSADHVVDGEGTVDFDGIVNFRWDTFLPTSLAAEIFPDMASTFLGKPRAHLGPIPVLVSGSILEPELKPDPAQVEDILRKIDRRRATDLLYELVLD